MAKPKNDQTEANAKPAKGGGKVRYVLFCSQAAKTNFSPPPYLTQPERIDSYYCIMTKQNAGGKKKKGDAGGDAEKKVKKGGGKKGKK
jgi:hypothetical protein